MKGAEGNYVRSRGETGSHKLKIPDTRNKDERSFDELVSNIFDRQKAVYELSEVPRNVKTEIAFKFYNNRYKYENIKLTYGHVEGANETLLDYIDAIIDSKQEVTRNKLLYLIGDVGVGKSAFINWIISTKLKSHVISGSLWFLRVDLEDLSKNNEAITKEEFVYHVASNLETTISKIRTMLKGCDQEIANLRKALDHSKEHLVVKYVDRCRAITSIINKAQSSLNRRFLLIIDNIDYVCHLNDRGLYYDNDDTGEFHIIQTICDLLAVFNRQNELGKLGANILVITRPDSYDVLGKVMATSYNSPAPVRESNAYYLTNTNINGAIESRCELLVDFVDKIEEAGKRNKLLKIPEIIREDINKPTPNLLDNLKGICNDSLRSIMDFFAKYGWIGGDEEDGKTRLVEDYPIGLLTQILNSYTRFSQNESKFPNIFLVNKYSVAAAYNRDHEHRHTYWLKYLILHFMSRNKFSTLTDIVDVFHASGTGYDELLIRECLGSLTDSTCSNCVTIERDVNPNHSKKSLIIKKIYVNKRGKHCLKHVFDKFYYLQLVVDDPHLPLPCILEETFDFNIADTRKLDYRYIVTKNTSDYYKQSKKMIAYKYNQVMHFMQVLDCSLQLEQKYFYGAFNNLSLRGIRLPSVDEMTKSIILEMRNINKHFDYFLNQDLIEIRASNRRNDIYESLEKMYKIHGDDIINLRQ